MRITRPIKLYDNAANSPVNIGSKYDNLFNIVEKELSESFHLDFRRMYKVCLRMFSFFAETENRWFWLRDLQPNYV